MIKNVTHLVRFYGASGSFEPLRFPDRRYFVVEPESQPPNRKARRTSAAKRRKGKRQ